MSLKLVCLCLNRQFGTAHRELSAFYWGAGHAHLCRLQVRARHTQSSTPVGRALADDPLRVPLLPTESYIER